MKTEYFLIGMALTLGCHAADVVLYDAQVSPLSTVSSYSEGKSSFVLEEGVLSVSTIGKSGYPGVNIKGNWDLSSCTGVTFELAYFDKKGPLPLTVQFQNEGANPGGQAKVFIDRIRLSQDLTTCQMALLQRLPHGREINKKLTGMRTDPLTSVGVVSDLDPAEVTAVAIYIKQPQLDWKWGIKRIVAHVGEFPPLPKWKTLSADEFFPFINVYGQFKYKEWPGKIHSDADLKAAAIQEERDLEEHPGPQGWSQFGGWIAGGKREATGHFRVEKIKDVWWMIDPEGYLYWSHGPVRVTPSTAITPLDERECYFTNLPSAESPFAKFYTTRDELLYPYYVARKIKRTYDFSSANCYRKYGEKYEEVFADLAHRRLRSWGMNTIANSSDKQICLMNRTPYTDRFELKSKALEGSETGWWPFRDPFDPSFRADVRRQMQVHQAEMEDPWCFGFFVDNELRWGQETDLAVWTLLSPADQVAKVEFRKWLQAAYGTVEKLNAVWGTSYADWDAFLTVCARPGKGAEKDLKTFSCVIVEAYFKNIREEFKKVAPDKLYMGCRFAGGGPRFVLEAGAKYCDVVSFNIYSRNLDNFKLPETVDKPVIIGEFHFGALDRGLFHPGLVKVANQKERGRTYVEYVTSALKHPFVVGVHWHQFGDQATTGRFDGENFQVGFVDCCNTPYPETIEAIREVGYHMYEIRDSAFRK